MNYTQYFDALTIHDMTLSNDTIKNLSPQNRISYISSYGRGNIVKFANYSQNIVKKPIYMTAYASHIEDEGFSFSVLHGMFGLSYIATTVCNIDNIQFLMQFVLSSQLEENGNIYGYYQASFGNGNKVNDTNNLTFNPLGQILAHLAWIAMSKNNKMFCLKTNINSCPKLPVNIKGITNLTCIYGVGFGNDKNVNSFGFVIVNSCNFTINASFQLNQITQLTKNVNISLWEYKYNQNGYGAKFVDCKGKNIWHQQCAVVKPTFNTMYIKTNQTQIVTELNPFSVLMSVTN